MRAKQKELSVAVTEWLWRQWHRASWVFPTAALTCQTLLILLAEVEVHCGHKPKLLLRWAREYRRMAIGNGKCTASCLLPLPHTIFIPSYFHSLFFHIARSRVHNRSLKHIRLHNCNSSRSKSNSAPLFFLEGKRTWPCAAKIALALPQPTLS